MLAALGPDFPAGYTRTLCALLFLVDLDNARAEGIVIFAEWDWSGAGAR